MKYNNYRPQTKLCFHRFLSVHRGCLPQRMLGYPPPHILGQTPPGQTPPVQCMLGYGQQAGGTHPTGMHSCLI